MRYKADGEAEIDEQTSERKEQSREKAKDWVAHDNPSSKNSSTKEFTKIDGNTMSHSINGIKENARIRVEQDVDLVLKKSKLVILGQPHDKMLLTAQKDDLSTTKRTKILKDGLLFRKHYGETSNIKY